MTDRKIAILRGINVGGKRRLLMSDLKSMFTDLGFHSIETYIQSGNVIFGSEESAKDLSRKIEMATADRFGYDVPVIVRTAMELMDSVERNPFYDESSDISKLHLTFLKEEPTEVNKSDVESVKYEPDRFVISGKDVFIHCEGKYHQSKLTNGFFEKKLQTGATTRNWKTVLKLVALSSGK